MYKAIRLSLIALTVATLASVFVGIGPYRELWPQWLIKLRSDIGEFQTLIGGSLALAAGALAYFGLREQILSTERHRKHDIELQRDERQSLQRARAAAIARQLSFACRNLTRDLKLLDDIVTNAAERSVPENQLLPHLSSIAFPKIRRSIEAYDELIRWSRDASLALRPKSQRNLIAQIDISNEVVRKIEIYLALCEEAVKEDENIDDSDVHALQEVRTDIEACEKILGQIVKYGGKTQIPEVQNLVDIQLAKLKTSAIKEKI